ncbi:MAG: aspartate aminotransferase family protein, partial [Methanomassiliicoccales archaeon]
ELPTETRIEFLSTLQSTLPGSLKTESKVMFTVTGADACEAAVSLARHVTRRRTIIAFSGAYHGIHGGIVEMTASRHYREYSSFGSGGVYHLPYPYAFRFPFHVKKGDEASVVMDMLRSVTDDPYSGVDPVAGVIVEPVQGEGGYIIPPDDFLPMLREFTEERGIPLILDEVQTGVGRTGQIWAAENAHIEPDIMCISKAIGGGIPLSLIAYRKEYDEGLPHGFHLGTYRGNPVAMAAGTAILSELKKGEILSKVRSRGEKIRSFFEEMASESSLVGDVRGRGFMIGVELVRDGLKPATEEARKLRTSLFRRGVLMHTCGHYGNVMRFMAPLTIEEELIEKGLQEFREAVLFG